MNANMGEKALDILALALHERGSEEWAAAMEALITRYGSKPFNRKAAELAQRGYLAYDVGAYPCRLTDKGRAALAAHGRTVA